MNSQSIITARAKDQAALADKYGEPRFSSFLDPKEQLDVKANSLPYGLNRLFFGGYESAERKMVGFYPSIEPIAEDDFPIQSIRFTYREQGLTHRDFLGALMSLSIKREVIGDILINETSAICFVTGELSEYIIKNLLTVGSQSVTVALTPMNSDFVPEIKTSSVTVTVQSLRLDAVLSAGLRISRESSASFVLSERVSVNHKIVIKSTYLLKEGDLLSIKGIGRLRLQKIGGESKKGRKFITLLRYE